MKKLMILVIAIAACAAPAAAPKARAIKGLVNDSCTKPPAKLYGADLASCKDDPDMGFCCGYGRTLALHDSKNGSMAMACGYIMCRDSCEAEFEMSIAMCLPTDPAKAQKEPGDEGI